MAKRRCECHTKKGKFTRCRAGVKKVCHNGKITRRRVPRRRK